MQAWRICKASEVNDFSGRGAALFGGRWNHIDQPAIYLGLCPASCALDAFIQIGHVPKLQLKLVELRLPDDPGLYFEPSPAQLPQGWDCLPADRPSMDYGAAWLEGREHLGLILPSVTMIQVRNLLLSPKHPAMDQVEVVDVGSFTFSRPKSTAATSEVC